MCEGPERNPGGGPYALDNRSNISDPLAAGAGDKLHDGRVDPHPVGHCHHRHCRKPHPGAQALVVR